MSDELTRRCGVCGEERPAAAIDVRRRHVLVDDGREHVQHDINFCRDRPACVEAARFDALFDEGPPTPTEVEAADRGLVALRDLGDGRELAVEVIGGSQGRLTVGWRVRLSYAAEVDHPTITQAWDALEDWPLGATTRLTTPPSRKPGTRWRTGRWAVTTRLTTPPSRRPGTRWKPGMVAAMRRSGGRAG